MDTMCLPEPKPLRVRPGPGRRSPPLGGGWTAGSVRAHGVRLRSDGEGRRPRPRADRAPGEERTGRMAAPNFPSLLPDILISSDTQKSQITPRDRLAPPVQPGPQSPWVFEIPWYSFRGRPVVTGHARKGSHDGLVDLKHRRPHRGRSTPRPRRRELCPLAPPYQRPQGHPPWIDLTEVFASSRPMTPRP